MNASGYFITLEGGEGAGKTTQMLHLREWFEQRGDTVLLTRQPGGTALAEKIRHLLLHDESEPIMPLTELLLLFAARVQFLSHVVEPALAKGHTVLCDRFTDSTYAYQGGGRGVSPEDIAVLEELVHGHLQPNLTFLLDIPVEQGMARAANRSHADRIEKENLSFFEGVRAAYLARANECPDRFEVIDARPAPDQVWNSIRAALESRFA